MKNLIKIIKEAEKNKVAVGHFNISDLTGLKAIFEVARELSSNGACLSARQGSTFDGKVPVIIGTSDGEADFVGRYQVAALVKSLRDQYRFPIFLNSDHTHELKDVEISAYAGYDAVISDGSKLSFEDNIKNTKKAVDLVKKIDKNILVEGELGYIGSSSKILDKLPEGAAINPEDLTKPDLASKFVKKTGVDLLAPAVGNLHGMFRGAKNPDLDIARIKAIKKAVGIPLVLHGGSGTKDQDFILAIKAGISVIHINTEIRVAWREGIEKGLKSMPQEITPYKVLPEAVAAMKKVVLERLRLFNGC